MTVHQNDILAFGALISSAPFLHPAYMGDGLTIGCAGPAPHERVLGYKNSNALPLMFSRHSLTAVRWLGKASICSIMIAPLHMCELAQRSVNGPAASWDTCVPGGCGWERGRGRAKGIILALVKIAKVGAGMNTNLCFPPLKKKKKKYLSVKFLFKVGRL